MSAAKSKAKATSDGKVSLTLAHPIAPPYHVALGLEPRPDADYRVGEDVEVTPSTARAIINAGYAQVDPENPEHVARALGIDDAEAAQVVASMLGEQGHTGTVDPGTPAT